MSIYESNGNWGFTGCDSDCYKTRNDAVKAFIESYDYKVVTLQEFMQASDKPEGLLERANKYQGEYILYDPNDDSEGFMIVGSLEHVLTEGENRCIEHESEA